MLVYRGVDEGKYIVHHRWILMGREVDQQFFDIRGIIMRDF